MSALLGPEGSVLTPDGWVAGRVLHEDGRIAGVEGEPLAVPAPPYLLPGFVDLHVHGGGGGDAMEGEAAVRRLVRFHARHGTVAIAPTTMTAPADDIAAALAGIAEVRSAPQPGEALVLGAHLEGPFINPNKLGAQPPFAIPPDEELAGQWLDLCPLVVATLAPELAGSEGLIQALAARGCRVQIGHSLASAEGAEAALEAGASGFTHLFNAMSGLDSRAPGVAAAALAVGRSAEMIADLIHVHPTMIRTAARAIPSLYAVTDATAATGGPDGEYRLGRAPVFKRGNRMTLADGRTIAGSVLTMDAALRNLVSIGFDLATAARMTATRPADAIGRRDLGRIEEGARASIVVLDGGLLVREVWIDGRPLGAG